MKKTILALGLILTLVCLSCLTVNAEEEYETGDSPIWSSPFSDFLLDLDDCKITYLFKIPVSSVETLVFMPTITGICGDDSHGGKVTYEIEPLFGKGEPYVYETGDTVHMTCRYALLQLVIDERPFEEPMAGFIGFARGVKIYES